jgi:hypothetical protein
MHTIALLVGLALGADAPECSNPPSRASDAYWPFIEACGCDALEPPSAASEDHARFLSACSDWRQRNPHTTVIVAEPTPSSPPDPIVTTSRTDSPECRNPPSRTSSSYWSYLEACGCANVDPPSRASADYDRFLKTCSGWRERNPRTEVIVPARPTRTSPSPVPTPTPAVSGDGNRTQAR